MGGTAEGSESADRFAHLVNPGVRQAFPRPLKVEQLGAEYDVSVHPVFTRITEGKPAEESTYETPKYPYEQRRSQDLRSDGKTWASLNSC